MPKREEALKNHLKILYEIHNLETAGAQRMMIDIAVRLRILGHDVFMLVLSDNPHNHFSDLIENNGIKVRYVECDNLDKFRKILVRYRAIGDTIKGFHPDIIHSHLDYKYLWTYALLHHTKFIATFHSQPYRLNTGSFKFLYSNLFKKHLINPVNLTKSNAEEFCDLFNTEIDNQWIIPNPIDLSSFNARNATDMRNDDGIVRICFAARFHPVKNHKMLIHAFHKLIETNPECELLLAGEGETKSHMEQFVRELGIDDRVIFLGDVSDIPGLLRKADIGVISSDSESFPLFLLECMATGLPVVLTRVGGMRDLVDGNGIFVEKGNIDHMADALRRLVDDENLRIQMGKRGLELVKQYDISTVANKYLDLYRTVSEMP